MIMSEIIYPIRINKYLSYHDICSRRQADIFIKAGDVTINRRIAKLGDKVQKDDQVEVNSRVKNVCSKYRYFLYNKPIGVVSHPPGIGEKGILQSVKLTEGIFPVGRLDKESHGLIILTNDGRITKKLLDAKYYHQKEYEVFVNKPVKESFLNKMAKGVKIEGYLTKKADIVKTGDDSFKITLVEGKKHQIRRMSAALGYDVVDLKRIRIGNVKLTNLKSGQSRGLKDNELKEFLSSIGL